MEMEYRRLGGSGLPISVFSYGAWVSFHYQMDVRAAEKCLALAWEHGINFFDNAEAYARGEAEEIMGKALHKLKLPRDGYLVSSKVFFGGTHNPLPTQKGLHRKHVTEACHQALRRLQLEYLDLYFCHRPDPETPIVETVRAMDDLVRQGKVLYWGTSEWSAEELREAYACAAREHLYAPVMEQPQYNLFHRHRVEQEYAPLYEEHGLGTTIWSPLYSGVLTGKYSRGEIPKDSRFNLPDYGWLRQMLESEQGQQRLECVRQLAAVAQELDAPVHHLALAWCLKNPRVSTVILGASRVEQLQDNLKALELLPRLDDAVMDKIDRLSSPLAD